MDTAPPNAEQAPPRASDLALLSGAVREAGAIALSYFRRKPVATRKADGTQVSEADLAVDASLRKALLEARPAYGWLSEETADDRTRLGRTRVWVVDPIDGTRAYLQERKDWTVAAALIDRGHPVLAIVFNPAEDEWFEAEVGKGTRLNGEPVHVRDGPIEQASLIVSGGFLKRRDWDRPWPPLKTRWVNSIAYRMALVAAGRFDATISLGWKSEWDLAAAHLLVQEAGGLVTTHSGESLEYNRGVPIHASLVAAGPKLHAALIDRTRKLQLK